MPESIDPRLNEFAAALSTLTPRSPALDRDRILFRAGQAAAPRPWFWLITATVTTSVAVVLGAVLLLRPTPKPVERFIRVPIAYVPPAKAPAKIEEKIPNSTPESEPQEPPYPWPSTPYTRLEDRLLRWGLDGLDEPPSSPAAPPETLKSLLQSL